MIYPEEITHCAAGVRWLRHLHEVARREKEKAAAEEEEEEKEKGEEGRGGNPSSSSSSSSSSQAVAPEWMAEAQAHEQVQTWFHALVSRHFAGSLKPPFNSEARTEAGFDESWYLPLALDDERRRREQAERGRREAAAEKEKEEEKEEEEKAEEKEEEEKAAEEALKALEV